MCSARWRNEARSSLAAHSPKRGPNSKHAISDGNEGRPPCAASPAWRQVTVCRFRRGNKLRNAAMREASSWVLLGAADDETPLPFVDAANAVQCVDTRLLGTVSRKVSPSLALTEGGTRRREEDVREEESDASAAAVTTESSRCARHQSPMSRTRRPLLSSATS